MKSSIKPLSINSNISPLILKIWSLKLLFRLALAFIIAIYKAKKAAAAAATRPGSIVGPDSAGAGQQQHLPPPLCPYPDRAFLCMKCYRKCSHLPNDKF